MMPFASATPNETTPTRSTGPAAPDRSPDIELIETASAIWKARALYAAAQLGLADLMAEGHRSAEELARASGTHAASLLRLLRALASFGVVTEIEPSRFRATRLGEALRTGAPGAARATVLTLAGDWQWKAWENVLHSLRTGQPALRKAIGKDLFDFLAANPVERAQFNEAMVGMHGRDGAAVVEAYDFSPFASIIDLGGGTGTLLTTILQSNHHLRGTLFERPETIPDAQRLIDARRLSGRCDVVTGDFFVQVPPGHDGYILAHVLHDWTDEQSVSILRNCRKAIPTHGRLLILESVLPPGDTPHPGKMMDLLMLTVTGGMERTSDEFSAMLSAADFKLVEVIATSTHQSLVEAIPV